MYPLCVCMCVCERACVCVLRCLSKVNKQSALGGVMHFEQCSAFSWLLLLSDADKNKTSKDPKLYDVYAVYA